LQLVIYITSFSLLAHKKKKQKERAADHLVGLWPTSLRYSKLQSAAKLASLKQSSRFFCYFFAARLRDMAFKAREYVLGSLFCPAEHHSF